MLTRPSRKSRNLVTGKGAGQRSFVLISIVTMTILFILGCDGVGATDATTEGDDAWDTGTEGDGASENTVYLIMEDNGTTVEIQVGWSLVVSLEENPSFGCSWTLAEVDALVLENTGDHYVSDDDRPDVPGAAGTSIWDFAALSEASTVLRLEMLHWNEIDPCTHEMALEAFGEVFEVTVNVTAE